MRVGVLGFEGLEMFGVPGSRALELDVQSWGWMPGGFSWITWRLMTPGSHANGLLGADELLRVVF